MSEHRRYSGPDLATLLRRVDEELGSDAVILKADRVRSGGMAGFFAREHYEVVASPSESEVGTVQPTVIADGLEVEADDEPISATPVAPPLPPSRTEPVLPALKPVTDPLDPAPARSIQAALLDRADEVSAEELLAQAAETGAAERANESFRAILGRTVAATAATGPDSHPPASGRPETPQVATRPATTEEPIVGFRPEPVRPGERVIDPYPLTERHQAANSSNAPGRPDPSRDLRSGPGIERRAFGAHDHRLDDPGDTTTGFGVPSTWPDDGRWHVPHPAGPPPFPAGPAPWPGSTPWWGPPGMHGWSPWGSGGWAAVPPQPPAPVHAVEPCRCPMCARPAPAPAIESAVLVNSRFAGWHRDHLPSPAADPTAVAGHGPEVPWSDIRREIDDAIRSRLDDIVRAVRQVPADGHCRCDQPAAVQRVPVDRVPGSAWPPPPQRPDPSRHVADRRRRLDTVADERADGRVAGHTPPRPEGRR